MSSQVIRCTDCGAIFKGVPSWLSTADVKFSCTNCPKRPSRIARFDPPAPSAALLAEPDADLEAVEIDEADEDADLDLDTAELDAVHDEKEPEEKDL